MRVINLLPPARQKLLEQEVVFGALLRFMGYSMLGFVLVIGAQFGVKLYLQNQAASIGDNIARLQSQVKKQENATTKEDIANINNYIADYKDLSQGIPKWSKVLKAFALLPPPGVVINSFSPDFDTKTITITGTALTRDAVIQLYNNILADSKEFTGIDYPLENVAAPKNNFFHFTFTVNDSLLK